jgi:ABC-2 type transport system ATP-binding protein
VDNGIAIEMEKDEVPNMIQLLIEKGIRIFEVKPIAKSLEDHFLEVTTQGEKLHA